MQWQQAEKAQLVQELHEKAQLVQELHEKAQLVQELQEVALEVHELQEEVALEVHELQEVALQEEEAAVVAEAEAEAEVPPPPLCLPLAPPLAKNSLAHAGQTGCIFPVSHSSTSHPMSSLAPNGQPCWNRGSLRNPQPTTWTYQLES